MDAINVNKFYWRYPTFTGSVNEFALNGISLQIRENEFFGITGPSGSGKTTLCFAISGLIPHQMHLSYEDAKQFMDGSIKVFGDTVSAVVRRNGKNVIMGKGTMAPTVGIVMQDPESQFLTMSVKQELSLGLQFMGIPQSEIGARIKEALRRVGMYDLYADSERIHPAELSGGQKQRLIIASFIAMRPKVLILDEPTSDLDPAGKMEVIDAIERIKEEHKLTVILVEHNPEIMQRFADRIAVMDKGCIVAVDTPEKIYSNKQLVEKHSIYAPELTDVKMGRGNRTYLTIESFVAHARLLKIKDERVLQESFEAIKEPSKELISVKDLDFSYGDGTHALNSISFKIAKGEFVALVGQNGSGKSTLSKVLSGIESSFKGNVNVMGMDLHAAKNRALMPFKVGYIFQNPDHQIFNRSVYSEVAYGLKNMGLPKEEINMGVKKALKNVGLESKASEDPLFLGKGQKRRLAVASVLAMEPEILIVDEPTTGQDYAMAKEIMELLKIMNDAGKTIFVITHDMRLVAEYCKRSIVMNAGSIIYDGSTVNLFEDDALLSKASLVAPQSVKLSKELRRIGMLNNILLTASDLNDFFSFSSMKTKYKRMDFGAMRMHAKSIASAIKSKHGAPSAIVYVQRGGMVFGRLLSDYLGVSKVFGIKASYYNEYSLPSKGVYVGSLNGVQENNGYILLVDDIIDTGKTMAAVSSKILPISRKLVTVALLCKEGSSFKPDFCGTYTSKDSWIIFDYEKEEAYRSFQHDNNHAGMKFIKENFR